MKKYMTLVCLFVSVVYLSAQDRNNLPYTSSIPILTECNTGNVKIDEQCTRSTLAAYIRKHIGFPQVTWNRRIYDIFPMELYITIYVDRLGYMHIQDITWKTSYDKIFQGEIQKLGNMTKYFSFKPCTEGACILRQSIRFAY